MDLEMLLMRCEGLDANVWRRIVFGQCDMFVYDYISSLDVVFARRAQGVRGASWVRDSCLWWGVKSANRR